MAGTDGIPEVVFQHPPLEKEGMSYLQLAAAPNIGFQEASSHCG
jgi:hypothetical protein